MSEAKHAPAPWVIIPPEPYDGDDEEFFGSFVYPGGIEADDGNPVCAFGWAGGSGHMFENSANPHLIAAAPDMLAVLLSLMPGKLIGESYDPPVPDDELLKEFLFTWGKLRSARAAIAKALGQDGAAS